MQEPIDIGISTTVIDLFSTQQIVQLATSNDAQIILAPVSGVTILGGNDNPAVGSSLSYPVALGTVLTTGKAVQLINAELVLATIDDLTSPYSTIGIYDAAVGQVVASGKITNSAWNWTLGRPLFLGRNGDLVHVPLVDSSFYLQIATVLTPTQIQINIQQPIYN